MLTELEIKEEPLDENENQQEMSSEQQEEAAGLLKQQQLQMDLIKEEHEDTYSLIGDNFHIVEEHDQFITVSAADMKTQDELQFIEKLRTPKNSSLGHNFVGSCPKCLKMFVKESVYVEHIKRKNCIAKQKCPACPLTFIDSQSLLKHLTMHRNNIFFCSQNCGASFKTFPLCEDHETQVHKLKNPPKIRYKHFCSYCREGFKTELQLHVHWLQQNKGCGKIMQEVALHSNIASNGLMNNNNSDSSVNNNNCNDEKHNSISPTNGTTMPPKSLSITKLRLKSNLPPLPANKRPLEENLNDETHLKRSKFVDNLKTKMTTMSNEMLFNLNTDVEIKDEPLDEDDIMNTTPLAPEVIIKTEEEKNDPEVKSTNETASTKKTSGHIEMQSLLINNNKEMNPEFQGKIIPFTVHSNSNKIPPLQRISSNIMNNSSNNNNNKIIMANKNHKIIKNNNNVANIISNNIVPGNNMASPINGNNNNSLKNITNLKYVRISPVPLMVPGPNNRLPQNIQIVPLQQQQQQELQQQQQQQPQLIQHQQPQLMQQQQQPQMDFKILPAPKMSLQIIKILPNTQLLTFNNDQQHQQQFLTTNNIHINCLQQQPLNIVKLQNAPIIIGPPIQQNNFQITKISTIPNLPQVVDTSLVSTTGNVLAMPPKPGEIISLNSSNDEFSKLQAEAMQKAEEHRIQYISKKNLIAIESLPEKKQLIDTMKQQIAKVAVGDTSLQSNKPATSPPPLMKISKDIEQDVKIPNSPSTLYLPILSTVDVELVNARYKYPDYIYKWICPYCLKDYDIKRCLKSHLTKAHNLNTRDMDKINVQAKPFKNQEVTKELDVPIVKQEAIELLPNTPPSETESLTSDYDASTSRPIKMSALNIIKPRYICEKCGRKCSSKTMLNDHISANCSREPQYPCTFNDCSKKFFSLSTLQCHMTIHTGELPHKCGYCEKRFRTRGQVTVHHRTHTGERPFVCQVCAQRFTHRETLIAHLSRHIGMKRYKCYCCDKHFSCISALKTHREIRPETCGKVKFNPRAIGPRVRVVRGNVIFEPQPEINPYLRSEDPKSVLSELQNQPESVK